ncbi:MAG TPA: hypothetical protein VNH64_08560 [Parvularculaceae bacterium]|nr:hypothetical protein [Parvularculaceae bacterium]
MAGVSGIGGHGAEADSRGPRDGAVVARDHHRQADANVRYRLKAAVSGAERIRDEPAE